MPDQTILANELRTRPGLLADLEQWPQSNNWTVAALSLAVLRGTADVSRSVEHARVTYGVAEVTGAGLLARSIERLACSLVDALGEVIRLQSGHDTRPAITASTWPDMIDTWDGAFQVPSNMSLEWRESPQPLLTWRFALWAHIEDLASTLSAVADGREQIGTDNQQAERALIETLAFALSALTWLNDWTALLASGKRDVTAGDRT